MGIDDIGLSEGNVREQVGEASEEDIARVREDMRKAAQIKGQIAQSVAHNKQYAQLLTILLQHISDEQLLGAIFQQLMVYHIEPTAIFAQFMPVLKLQIDLTPYHVMFEEIRERVQTTPPTAEGIIDYLKRLRQASEPIGAIHEEVYRPMVERMVVVYTESTDQTSLQERLQDI